MFGNISVKLKLMGLITFSLFVVTLILTYVTISNMHEAIVKDRFNQLTSIEQIKKVEIENYFNSIKELLTSLADNEGTKDAFTDLQKGFYSLKGELNLDISQVKNELKKDFGTNYLEKVNYSVPNAESQNLLIHIYLMMKMH